MKTELKQILQALTEAEHLELLNRLVQANEFRRAMYKHGLSMTALAKTLEIGHEEAASLIDGTHGYGPEILAKVTVMDRERTAQLEKARQNGAKQ